MRDAVVSHSNGVTADRHFYLSLLMEGHRSYLRGIAELFFRQKGKELYKYRFFFQNKRAGIFFLHYLRQQAGEGIVLLPEVTTLYNYLRRKSNIPEEDVNNDLILVYHLYRVYIDVLKLDQNKVTFESFYDMGRQLLADFNDIDNHLVDTKLVFSNMEQLEELTITPPEFLDRDQIEALNKFINIDLTQKIGKKFDSFWALVPEIYSQFKSVLREETLTYHGMLMRDIIERIEEEQIDFASDGKINVFVGLNALSLSEQKVLKLMKERTENLFYWDYDSDLFNHSFIEKSKIDSEKFPEPIADLVYERPKNSDHRPTMEIISIASKVGQSTYVSQTILPEIEFDDADPDTAIILPDESQLIPLLSNLNLSPEKLNITMGFPVKHLPAVAKLIHLLALQRRAFQRGRSKNPSLSSNKVIWRKDELSELLALGVTHSDFNIDGLLGRDGGKKIYFSSIDFKDVKDPAYKLQLLSDSDNDNLLVNTLRIISQMKAGYEETKSDVVASSDQPETKEIDANLAALTMLEELLDSYRKSIQKFIADHADATNDLLGFGTLYDLIHTSIVKARVPFTGEPLRGLQVMGVLEARSIDFKNIIVLDAGEGFLPANSRKYGLLPQNLRAGYGLPTYQWQDSIRAYNFFRMISRADHLYALYDSRKNERSSGEPSRYLRLLTHIYNTKAKYKEGFFALNPVTNTDVKLDKEKIRSYRAKVTASPEQCHLSPSRFMQYLTCPRMFYFHTILGLKEPDEVNELMEPKDIGEIIHKSIELLYKDYEDKEVNAAVIDQLLQKVDNAVAEAYRNTFSQNVNIDEGYYGVYKDMIVNTVKSILEVDKSSSIPFTYIKGEKQISHRYCYDKQNGKWINLKGFIDRLDIHNGVLRVIDYKTGKDQFRFNLEKCFDLSAQEVNKAAIQLLIYSEMLTNQPSTEWNCDEEHIVPILFKPRDKEQRHFEEGSGKSKVEVKHYGVVRERFLSMFNETLTDILEGDLDTAFRPINIKNMCEYCAGRKFCTSYQPKKY